MTFPTVQTVPETETTATFIKNAMNNAIPLSIRKYLHASCMPASNPNIFYFDQTMFIILTTGDVIIMGLFMITYVDTTDGIGDFP